MSDRDVQREIEENERRVRDEQDVGLDEDTVRERDAGGTFLDDLAGGLLGGDDDSEKREVEYDDRRRHGKLKPE